MMRALSALALPFLLKLKPETAHRAAIAALRLAPAAAPPCDPRLGVAAFGLTFANPLGLAAGFDKNAEVARGLLGAGFGFVEVGTLTPRPQSGNPRPRLFRLHRDAALINRLGFNNGGYAAAHARLSRAPLAGILGVNIGPNKDSSDRIADYVLGVRTFADVASYFTINVSSPNTPGLRDLQQRAALDELIARVIEARDACPTRRPVLVKIAPDVDLATLDNIVSVGRARGIDGMIVSNTTISRPPGLSGASADESGGLSGRPLFDLSTRTLARAFLRSDGAFALIGCGGVDSAAAALAKIEAGASLVQLYTALIYRGPGLIDEILCGLAHALDARRIARLNEIVGAAAPDWATAKN
ncbi:quinone-dependent dihydroorotate dehydrogenase [Methylocapsa sp. S129]|uniref:quinone-dependent dihydroorotate dehydrogenase n=1 Tax=Methylocapsa sp. S129 TaxID=1641869 RepID=UPI00131C0F0D|nr:quinone-dependent dihydroorotate dehydrogenase [Methylocapsa sp. S129]